MKKRRDGSVQKKNKEKRRGKERRNKVRHDKTGDGARVGTAGGWMRKGGY